MRGFWSFWTARTVSRLGTSFSTFAIPVYLFDRGNSATVVGLTLAASAAPTVLAPVAGVVADRIDPRSVLIGCDIGLMLATAVIALLLPGAGVLAALVVLGSFLSTLFLPAGKSMVPKFVAREHLGRANALLGISSNASIALGPVIAAVVYAAAGPRAAFGTDAASYAISALVMLTVRKVPPSGSSGRPLAALREGLGYVARDRLVRAVAIGLLLGVMFAAMDNTALVFLLRDSLHGSVGSPGFALSAFGVGMIAVPLLLLTFLVRRKVRGVTLVVLGLAVNGAGLALMGVAPTLVLAIAAFGFAGIGNGLENIGVDTAVGSEVPDALLGRVFGAVYAPLSVADVIASASAGPLVGLTSPGAVFVVAGLGSVAAAGVVVLLIRPRR